MDGSEYTTSLGRKSPMRLGAYPIDANLPHSCKVCGEVNEVQFYRTVAQWLCRGCSRTARLTVEPTE